MNLGYDNPGSYESTGFGLIPKGWQPMKLVEASEKTNDSGWRGANLTFEVAGGEHKGRTIYSLFTTHHATSTQAVEIGRGNIGHLLKAADKADSVDLNDCLGVWVRGYVSVKKGTGGYEDKNQVIDFEPFEAGQVIPTRELTPREAQEAVPAGAAPAMGWNSDEKLPF
jgi:hypothetical protein